MGRGDVLMGLVRASGDDVSAHDLPNEFLSGYPIEQLRQLLTSEYENDVKIGAWIASELGDRVRPLLNDCVELLKHPSRYVRFFALDCLLAAATPDDGIALAKAVELISDGDSAVRWKAMNFLANATCEQLAASASHTPAPLSGLLTGLRQVGEIEPGVLETRLTDPTPVVRAFAAVAAVRMAKRDPTALLAAARSPHNEISSFAKERLEVNG